MIIHKSVLRVCRSHYVNICHQFQYFMVCANSDFARNPPLNLNHLQNRTFFCVHLHIFLSETHIRKQTRLHEYTHSHMLNPHCYPGGARCGIRIQRSQEPLREMSMPMRCNLKDEKKKKSVIMKRHSVCARKIWKEKRINRYWSWSSLPSNSIENFRNCARTTVGRYAWGPPPLTCFSFVLIVFLIRLEFKIGWHHSRIFWVSFVSQTVDRIKIRSKEADSIYEYR